MTGSLLHSNEPFLMSPGVPVNPVIDPSLRTALQVRINHAVPSKLQNKENMQQTQVREEDGEMPGAAMESETSRYYILLQHRIVHEQVE
jgi:hypothetical protein